MPRLARPLLISSCTVALLAWSGLPSAAQNAPAGDTMPAAPSGDVVSDAPAFEAAPDTTANAVAQPAATTAARLRVSSGRHGRSRGPGMTRPEP